MAISETRAEIQATERRATSRTFYRSVSHSNVFETYIKHTWNKKTKRNHLTKCTDRNKACRYLETQVSELNFKKKHASYLQFSVEEQFTSKNMHNK